MEYVNRNKDQMDINVTKLCNIVENLPSKVNVFQSFADKKGNISVPSSKIPISIIVDNFTRDNVRFDGVYTLDNKEYKLHFEYNGYETNDRDNVKLSRFITMTITHKDELGLSRIMEVKFSELLERVNGEYKPKINIRVALILDLLATFTYLKDDKDIKREDSAKYSKVMIDRVLNRLLAHLEYVEDKLNKLGNYTTKTFIPANDKELENEISYF